MKYVVGDVRKDKYNLLWLYTGDDGWKPIMDENQYKQAHESHFPMPLLTFHEGEDPTDNPQLNVLDGLRENLGQLIFWSIFMTILILTLAFLAD